MRKTILFFCAIFCTSFPLFAHIAENEDKIFISVMLPETGEIPVEATKQLEQKLGQLLMQNGIANDDPSNRFVLTAKVAILSKDIVPGPPQKVSMNIDFTFIIGDAEENKKFESATISTVGVGINENKAFIAAIKNIKPKSQELVSLLHDAKKEIVDYYSLRCTEIKNEAAKAAAMRDYDKAIYLLMQIPDVCDCSEDCQNLAIQYSTSKINEYATSILNQAKAIWAADPTSRGASEVASLIAEIPVESSSQTGVDALVKEINQKLRADQKRDWDFKMKQYNDRIEKQKRDDQARIEQQRADNAYRSNQQAADNAYRAKQQAADNERRKVQQAADNSYRAKQQEANNAARTQAIEAARQIGVAYAKNQPQSVTYQRNVILW